jgi:hypothetical protein
MESPTPTTDNANSGMNNNNQKKTKEDLLVTDLGKIEPLYDEFDGQMYGMDNTS